MKNILLVALGNAGYENTYHNAGSDLILKWLQNNSYATKLKANLYKLLFNNTINLYILICPDIMNISGLNTKKIYDYYKCIELIVVVDDLDTDGIKHEMSTRSKGHNGVRSIKQYFDNFTRILIGIGRHEIMSVFNYVLSQRTEEYNKKLYNEILLKFHNILVQYLYNK